MTSVVENYSGLVELLSSVPAWQSIIVIFVVSLLIGKTLELTIERGIPVVLERYETEIGELLLKRLPVGLYTTVLMLGSYFSLVALETPPEIQAPLVNVIVTAFIAVWNIVIIRVGRGLSEVGKSSKSIDEGLIPIFKNIWTVLIGLSGLFMVMDVWGIDVTPFLASAGIIGIAVGFAAKDTIANFFGSIALYIDGTYAVGDYIVLETGEQGWVEDISVRSTQVRTRDDVMVTVPNSMLNAGKVVNESTPTPKRRMRVSVDVDYESDVDRVIEVLEEVGENEEMVVDVPQPKVFFKEFGESSLKFDLLAWIPNPATRPKVEHKLNRAVQQRLRKEGISIPFPQRVISERKRIDDGDGVGGESESDGTEEGI